MESANEQPKERLTHDEMVFTLLTAATTIVKDTSQTLANGLSPDQQSELPKLEWELYYFFVFALDYWWQQGHTQEQKRIFGKVLSSHLDIFFGQDTWGQARWDALQERLIAYGEIANEQKDDSAKLHSFAVKLSEYCGVGWFHFAVLAPSLFKTALDTVSVLEADKERLK